MIIKGWEKQRLKPVSSLKAKKNKWEPIDILRYKYLAKNIKIATEVTNMFTSKSGFNANRY